MGYNRILLIDDDTEDHEIFISALKRVSSELHCTAIENPSMALDGLLSRELTPDVIFLDLNMPTMSGQEFLARVKEVNIDRIPIIIYSTSSNPGTIKAAKELGAIRFITKPDSYETLIEMLKTTVL